MLHPGELIFDVRYPRRRSALIALLALIRPLLILPHLVVNAVLGAVVLGATIVAWVAILVTGRYPLDLWHLSVSVVERGARVGAYAFLLRHDYPPFRAAPYPVRFELCFPGRQSRPLLFLRWVMLLPQVVVLPALGVALVVTTLVSWLAVLLTGSYPQPLFAFAVGVQRWMQRVLVYALLLSDVYPAFSLGPWPVPMGEVVVPESWALPTTTEPGASRGGVEPGIAAHA